MTHEPHHPAGARTRRTASRVLVLVALAALALPASAPGASAAQPTGVGNVHLVPRAAPAYQLAAQVLPRGDQPPPTDPGTDWLPLLILAGLLLTGSGGYVLYTRRRAA